MFEDKEVVIFDLDGTLVDLILNWKIIRKKLLEAFPGIGIKSTGVRTTFITEKIKEKFGKESRETAYKMVREFERNCPIKPIEKTIELAKSLHKEGKKLAVFSSNCHDTIEEILKKLGIRELFDFIVGKEDIEEHKPDTEGLYKIMNHFGIEKSKVVFIGNENDIDMKAAKTSGVTGFLIQDI